MTFDWGAAWSVMGIAGIALLAVVMVLAAMFAAVAAEEKYGMHIGAIFVCALLLMMFVVAGFVGGGAL